MVCLAFHIVVPVLAVSGTECVDGLVAAGCELVQQSTDEAVLIRGLRRITVPMLDLLSREQLLRILHDADLQYVRFLDVLSALPVAGPKRRESQLRRRNGMRAAG